jgi:uncharacterized membrane protein YhaH (DUF805 family)
MGFGRAVSTCFQKYATFSGRARRAEYWWWVLFSILLTALAVAVDFAFDLRIKNDLGGSQVGWVQLVVMLGLIIPNISVTFRRLHDTDRSGFWWLLSLLCGLGQLILFILCLLAGTRGPNRYGPEPR